MKMKNILWFLHKPSDERESMLYSIAYSRSFKFIMFVLVLLFIVFSRANTSIPGYIIFFVLLLLLITTHLVGWSTFVNEDDLSDESIQKQTKTPLWLIAAWPAAFVAYALIIVFLFPKTMDVIQLFIVCFSLEYILLVAYSLKVSRQMPFYIRALLSVLQPVFTIFFATSKRYYRNKFLAALESIGYVAVMGAVLALTVLFMRMFIFVPFYSSTDYFAPHITKGQYMIIKRVSKDLSPGAYIIFRNEEKRPIIGKIINYNSPLLDVEIGSGTVRIDKKQVVGSVFR